MIKSIKELLADVGKNNSNNLSSYGMGVRDGLLDATASFRAMLEGLKKEFDNHKLWSHLDIEEVVDMFVKAQLPEAKQ